MTRRPAFLAAALAALALTGAVATPAPAAQPAPRETVHQAVATDEYASGPQAATVGSTALAGSTRSYTFMSSYGGRPARWNPCTTVRWRFNPSGAPAGAREDTAKALSILGSAMGVRFVYAGTTSYVAYRRPAMAVPTNAEVFVSWATPTQVPSLAGSTVGVGGHQYVVRNGKPTITKGWIVLDRTQPVRRGWTTGPTLGSLLLHELGHAVNLGHVGAREQVMYGALHSTSRAGYQAGDRTGLDKLGRRAGCL